MNNIFINMIYVVFPICLYILLFAHNKIMRRDKSNFIFDFTLVLSLTFIFSFSNTIYIYDNSYLVYIPLLLGYLKRRNVFVVFTSIFFMFYLPYYYGYNYIFVIINLVLIFIIYKVYKNKYDIIYTIINSIFLFIYHGFDIDYIMIIIIYFITTGCVLYFCRYISKVMKFYMSLKEIENNKQIQESLFKISHEVKNPIAVCKGYLELLDGSLDKYNEYVPIISKEINHSLSILKDFSSIGKLKIELDIMDLGLLINEVISDYDLILKSKKIKLINKSEYDELLIMGDYVRLKEVFINIIKNSIEALDGVDNPVISIITKIRNGKIVVKVIDNGCGIDSSEVGRISEPFFTTKKDGTGLGTYLSKEIISNHNGSINYYSSINNGMKVILEFDNYII